MAFFSYFFPFLLFGFHLRAVVELEPASSKSQNPFPSSRVFVLREKAPGFSIERGIISFSRYHFKRLLGAD